MNSFKSMSVRMAAIAVAALGLGAGVAHAQTVGLTGQPGSITSTVYYNNLNNGTTYGSSWGGGAFRFNDGTSTFYAYCIDPNTSGTGGGASVYNRTSLNSFLNTLALPNNTTGYTQQMVPNYNGLAYTQQSASLVESSLVNLFSHAYNDSLSSATKAAAFSYAVWEIMGESSYSRTAGALRGSGSDSTSYAIGNASRDSLEVQIDAYLSALTNNSWSSVNGASLTTVTNYSYTVYWDPTTHSNQNFIKVTPSGVPEPASLALVAAAMLGVAASRRSKKS